MAATLPRNACRRSNESIYPFLSLPRLRPTTHPSASIFSTKTFYHSITHPSSIQSQHQTMHTLSTLLSVLPLILQPWLCQAATAHHQPPNDSECAVSKSPIFDPFWTIYFSQAPKAGSPDVCQRYRLPGYSRCFDILEGSNARKASTIQLPRPDPSSGMCWECTLYK